MKKNIALGLCLALAAGFGAALAYGLNRPASTSATSLPPFEFSREGAASPEDAALALFQGVATESPKHFVQHILLGVCDGSIDTLQKFAECLHTTEFTHQDEAFDFYELRAERRGINRKQPMQIIAISPFDSERPEVKALGGQMISTYYAEEFVAADVSGVGYDGLEYKTRIVAAKVDGGWFGMPRCRSSQSFYEVADSMKLIPTQVEQAN